MPQQALEPEDFPALMELVERLVAGTDGVIATRLRETKARLLDNPAEAFSLEIPAYWRDRASKPMHNLPIAEFDDTGFLGRQKDRESLRRLLLSAHPVISVIGEGGVGKTALAQRCLYDFVAEGDAQPFDAIVWVSLKTRSLVVGGTRDIRDAVKDVLGLLRTATVSLGAPASPTASEEELLSEVLEYMTQFKVLLAVDNLETLTTGALRDLLLALPSGSKILLTSRLPLGEFEVRYTLDRMDERTARLLLRRFAAVLNVKQLATLPDESLAPYSSALFGNPLLIKWFVASVSAGEDPTRLLANRGQAFDAAVAFCFENLFDRLTDTERQLLHTIAAARRPLTRGELMLLAQRKPNEIEAAIVGLNNSSMVRLTHIQAGDVFELTPIASAYVERLRPPSSELVQEVSRRLASVERLARQDVVARAGYEYHPNTFEWKTRDELIATSLLRIAVAEATRQNFDSALRHVAQALQVAPTFSEVHRIEARVRERMGEDYRAAEAFERALQYAPQSPRLRYFYALFLMNRLEDNTQALEHLAVAETHSPKDVAVMSAAAAALTRTGRYSDAAAKFEELLASPNREAIRKHRIAIRDQAAVCYSRWLDRDISQDDEPAAVLHFEAGLKVLTARGESAA